MYIYIYKFDVQKFGVNLNKYILIMYLNIRGNFANKFILLVFKTTIRTSYITNFTMNDNLLCNRLFNHLNIIR